MRTTADAKQSRNAQGRLRMDRIEVDIHLGAPAATIRFLDRALAQFEDFCVVTQSVRTAIPARVRVLTAAAGADRVNEGRGLEKLTVATGWRLTVCTSRVVKEWRAVAPPRETEIDKRRLMDALAIRTFTTVEHHFAELEPVDASCAHAVARPPMLLMSERARVLSTAQ